MEVVTRKPNDDWWWDASELLKLLIKAHEAPDSKVKINWNDVAIKVVARACDGHNYHLLTLVEQRIKTYSNKDSKIINWNEVAISASQSSTESLKILIAAHKAPNSTVNLINWDEVAISSSWNPESLKILIEEHKDENSKVKITNWNEVAISASQHPESLKILIEEHKKTVETRSLKGLTLVMKVMKVIAWDYNTNSPQG